MTQETKPLSIIVPTLNEAGNLPSLFKRIGVSLNAAQIPYEIVLVDDHSSDDTLAVAKAAASEYPIRIFTKRGERGKAYSLLEGFDYAAYELVCMIDADLQYPPEAIAPMYEQLAELEADVVITERVEQHTSFLRQLSSKVFNLIFTRALFGIQYDTQSGLKLFKQRYIFSRQLLSFPRLL
jgi:glycosyltransferase involved in cell wall biosynthesis